MKNVGKAKALAVHAVDLRNARRLDFFIELQCIWRTAFYPARFPEKEQLLSAQ